MGKKLFKKKFSLESVNKKIPIMLVFEPDKF